MKTKIKVLIALVLWVIVIGIVASRWHAARRPTLTPSADVRHPLSYAHLTQESTQPDDIPRALPFVVGGIHNQEDLNSYSLLYPGCDTSQAVFTTTDHPAEAYVGYMLGGVSHFSRTRRVIPAGEPIVVMSAVDDRKPACIILQKCGNPIVFYAPPAETQLPYDPADIYPPLIMEPPEPPVIPPYGILALPDYPTLEPGEPITRTPAAQTPVNPIPGFGTLILPAVGPSVPINTPEPSVGMLVITGLLAIGVIKLWRI